MCDVIFLSSPVSKQEKLARVGGGGSGVKDKGAGILFVAEDKVLDLSTCCGRQRV